MSNQNLASALHCATPATTRVCAVHRAVQSDRPADLAGARCLQNELGNLCVAPQRTGRRRMIDRGGRPRTP
jgi:hypothetical protein